MTYRRSLSIVLPMLLWLASLAAACGGFDPAEAKATCQDIQSRQTQCFASDGVMEACIACHEDCGRDCTVVEGARCDFTCD
jgi:hypothetical protein